MNKMLTDNKIWAVVGATDNKEKFGYKIYKKLKENNYDVYPVSPVYTEIDGEKCYPNLSVLPKVPEAIDMVVSPKRGKDILTEASNLGIKNVLFQPGTYDDQLIDYAKELGMNILLSCVLVELG